MVSGRRGSLLRRSRGSAAVPGARCRQPVPARRAEHGLAGAAGQPLGATAGAGSDADRRRRGAQRVPGVLRRPAAAENRRAGRGDRRRGTEVRAASVRRHPAAEQSAPERGVPVRQPDPDADERRRRHRRPGAAVLPRAGVAVAPIDGVRARPGTVRRADRARSRSSRRWAPGSPRRVAATSRPPGRAGRRRRVSAASVSLPGPRGRAGTPTPRRNTAWRHPRPGPSRSSPPGGLRRPARPR